MLVAVFLSHLGYFKTAWIAVPICALAAALVARGVAERAVDAGYGVLAALIVIVGFARATFAAKGWTYYAHNAFFWAKIATFIVIGLLSVAPTLAYLKWQRAGASPTDKAVAKARRYLWMEVALFPLLLAFAAAMARGYGMY